MTTSRKKWRLQIIPMFTYQSVPSRAAAYRQVEQYREDYANRLGRVHHVNVEVNEDGRWALYERIVFPEGPDLTRSPA